MDRPILVFAGAWGQDSLGPSQITEVTQVKWNPAGYPESWGGQQRCACTQCAADEVMLVPAQLGRTYRCPNCHHNHVVICTNVRLTNYRQDPDTGGILPPQRLG